MKFFVQSSTTARTSTTVRTYFEGQKRVDSTAGTGARTVSCSGSSCSSQGGMRKNTAKAEPLNQEFRVKGLEQQRKPRYSRRALPLQSSTCRPLPSMSYLSCKRELHREHESITTHLTIQPLQRPLNLKCKHSRGFLCWAGRRVATFGTRILKATHRVRTRISWLINHSERACIRSYNK